MTMPNERSNAVKRTQEFLRDLLDPKKTPKVPRSIRQEALRCLRHYPWPMYIDQSAKVLPDVWGPLERDDK